MTKRWRSPPWACTRPTPPRRSCGSPRRRGCSGASGPHTISHVSRRCKRPAPARLRLGGPPEIAEHVEEFLPAGIQRLHVRELTAVSQLVSLVPPRLLQPVVTLPELLGEHRIQAGRAGAKQLRERFLFAVNVDGVE